MAELPNLFDSLLEDNKTTTTEQVEVEGSSTTETGEISQPELENQSNSDSNEEVDINPIEEFLKEKGIEDVSKIKYETEDGEIQEVDFNSLSGKEQLTILKELSTPDLSESEINTVQWLRNNGVTLEQAIDYFKQTAVEEYKASLNNNAPEQHYDVDSYSDDELYFADLKARYTSMSDEELKYELDKAKENEDLFKKKVEIIRNDYKEKEKEAALEAQRREEEEYNQLRSALTESVSNFKEISFDYKDPESDVLVIEDDEKSKILSYLLEQDTNGYSQFFKDLNDPKVLVELAWYKLFGQDAISNISEYWKDILKQERRTAKSNKNSSASQTVVDKTNTNDKSEKPKTLSDLYDKYYR